MPLKTKNGMSSWQKQKVHQLEDTKAIMAKEGDQSTIMLLISQLNSDQLLNMIKGGSTFIGQTTLEDVGGNRANQNLLITAEQYYPVYKAKGGKLEFRDFKFDYTHHVESHHIPTEMEKAKAKLGRDDNWYRPYNLVPEIADFIAGMAWDAPGARLFSRLNSRNEKSVAYLLGAVLQVAARSTARVAGTAVRLGATKMGKTQLGKASVGVIEAIVGMAKKGYETAVVVVDRIVEECRHVVRLSKTKQLEAGFSPEQVDTFRAIVDQLPNGQMPVGDEVAIKNAHSRIEAILKRRGGQEKIKAEAAGRAERISEAGRDMEAKVKEFESYGVDEPSSHDFKDKFGYFPTTDEFYEWAPKELNSRVKDALKKANGRVPSGKPGAVGPPDKAYHAVYPEHLLGNPREDTGGVAVGHGTLQTRRERQAWDFTNQGYKDPVKRRDVGDFKYQKNLSDDEVGVWYDEGTNKVHITHRGSVTKEDWLRTDPMIGAGAEKWDPRMKRAIAKVLEIRGDYPNAVIDQSAHSLGGGVLSYMATYRPTAAELLAAGLGSEDAGKMMVTTILRDSEITTFNAANSAFGRNGILWNLPGFFTPDELVALNGSVLHVRADIDVVSFGNGGFAFGKTRTYNFDPHIHSKNYKIGDAHRLTIFKREGSVTTNVREIQLEVMRAFRNVVGDEFFKEEMKQYYDYLQSTGVIDSSESKESWVENFIDKESEKEKNKPTKTGYNETWETKAQIEKRTQIEMDERYRLQMEEQRKSKIFTTIKSSSTSDAQLYIFREQQNRSLGRSHGNQIFRTANVDSRWSEVNQQYVTKINNPNMRAFLTGQDRPTVIEPSQPTTVSFQNPQEKKSNENINEPRSIR